MALAHLVRSDFLYSVHFQVESRNGSYVLLDNGAFEDSMVGIDELVNVAEEIEATEMVLPDSIGDGKATVRAVTDALEYVVSRGHHKYHRLMAVAQGADLYEWSMCAEQLLDIPEIDTLGIPKKLLTDVGPNARARALQLVKNRLNGRKTHLLGCGENPAEPRRVNNEHPGVVRGVDSSIAYVYSVEYKRVREGLRPDYTIDFVEPATCDSRLLRVNMFEWEGIE